MEPGDGDERQRRGACLSILLTGAAVSVLLMIVVLATGGWAMYVVWIAAAIFSFGLIHYLLWGRWMLRSTAGEREEEEVRQKAGGAPGGAARRQRRPSPLSARTAPAAGFRKPSWEAGNQWSGTVFRTRWCLSRAARAAWARPSWRRSPRPARPAFSTTLTIRKVRIDATPRRRPTGSAP